jgi:CysZ protein
LPSLFGGGHCRAGGGFAGLPTSGRISSVNPAARLSSDPARPSAPADFATGIGMLGRGMTLVARSPGLMLLGMLPALISFLLLLAGFVVVIWFIGPESRALTWFARDWPDTVRHLTQLLAGVAIIGLAGWLAIVVYTGLTLVIGDPFYEKISEKVEAQFGGVPGAVDLPFWRELRRSIRESLRLMAFSTVVAILLFIGGLVPGVGQTVIPVIAALIGGWALAIELTGIAFARRGLRLADRRRMLRKRRWLALGFGVSVFVCFLIPFGAILVMPGAVAGATLLTRHLHHEPC